MRTGLAAIATTSEPERAPWRNIAPFVRLEVIAQERRLYQVCENAFGAWFDRALFGFQSSAWFALMLMARMMLYARTESAISVFVPFRFPG